MKKFFSRLAEFAFLFFLSAYLIKIAACWLYSVWPVLIVTGIIAVVVIIIYRIVKHKDDSGQW